MHVKYHLQSIEVQLSGIVVISLNSRMMMGVAGIYGCLSWKYLGQDTSSFQASEPQN